jgi:hypothetical protein
MIEKLELVMQELIKKTTATDESSDAMRYSQAVLNVAHALATVKNLPSD